MHKQLRIVNQNITEKLEHTECSDGQILLLSVIKKKTLPISNQLIFPSILSLDVTPHVYDKVRFFCRFAFHSDILQYCVATRVRPSYTVKTFRVFHIVKPLQLLFICLYFHYPQFCLFKYVMYLELYSMSPIPTGCTSVSSVSLLGLFFGNF